MIGRVPDPGELAEDLKELKTKMDQDFRELRLDLRGLDHTYLNERLYKAESRARDAEIDVLRKNIDVNFNALTKRIEDAENERTANRRLTLAALVFPTLVFLLTFILPRILIP